MKQLQLANAASFAALLFLGYQFLLWDNKITEEFLRVGWQNYEGPDIDTPGNIFSLLLIFLSGFTIYLGIKTITKKSPFQYFGLAQIIIAGATLIFGLMMRIQDGAISMEESIVFWIAATITNALISLGIYRLHIKKIKAFSEILDAPHSLDSTE